MTNGHWILELTRRTWVELDEEERAAFAEWLKGAKPHDLYMLVRHVRREATRKRISSVKAFNAVQPPAETSDD